MTTAYIGHGTVELAVSLTFVHTLLAPLLTPAFTQVMASKRAEPALPIVSALLVYAIVLGLFSKAAPAVRAHAGLMPLIIGTTTVLIIVNLAVGGPFAALPGLLNTIMNLIVGALLSCWLQHRTPARPAAVPAPRSAPEAVGGRIPGPSATLRADSQPEREEPQI